jgi:hypothetical protein
VKLAAAINRCATLLKIRNGVLNPILRFPPKIVIEGKRLRYGAR